MNDLQLMSASSAYRPAHVLSIDFCSLTAHDVIAQAAMLWLQSHCPVLRSQVMPQCRCQSTLRYSTLQLPHKSWFLAVAPSINTQQSRLPTGRITWLQSFATDNDLNNPRTASVMPTSVQVIVQAVNILVLLHGLLCPNLPGCVCCNSHQDQD